MIKKIKGLISKLFNSLDEKLEKKSEEKAPCNCKNKDKSCCK